MCLISSSMFPWALEELNSQEAARPVFIPWHLRTWANLLATLGNTRALWTDLSQLDSRSRGVCTWQPVPDSFLHTLGYIWACSTVGCAQHPSTIWQLCPWPWETNLTWNANPCRHSISLICVSLSLAHYHPLIFLKYIKERCLPGISFAKLRLAHRHIKASWTQTLIYEANPQPAWQIRHWQGPSTPGSLKCLCFEDWDNSLVWVNETMLGTGRHHPSIAWSWSPLFLLCWRPLYKDPQLGELLIC